MHWVIDRRLERTDPLGNRSGELGYVELLRALERFNTPYTLVKTIPFVGTPVDPDTNEPIVLDIKGPVFVTGTMGMRNPSREYGWSPGYVDAPGQSELIEHWGSHVLNHDAVIGAFSEVQAPSDEFFARPVEDTKSFAGTIYSAAEWNEWRATVIGLETSNCSIQPDDQVLLAPLKNIYAEYRLYVVGGQIITGSRYKLGGRVFYTRDLDPAMLDYAKARIAEYCPRAAMCLDIAHIEGEEPYKVIETNAISSAGFYACDMGAFVGAINAFYGD